jgi:multiple sugar transport system permease protein
MTSMETVTRPRSRKRIDGWRWGGRFFLLFMLFYTAVPMIWMLITSIKSGFAAMQFPPQWWPKEPTLASYQKLLDPQNSVGQDFLRFFWNSFYVSVLTTLLAVIVAVPAAYAFSRFTFPGRKFLFFSVLLRNMFPAVIFLVPLFILMRWLGLVNTHGSLILTYLTFGLPLAIWLLKGFYDNIPIQLEQAARIDGATRFQVPGLPADRFTTLGAGHHCNGDLLLHRRVERIYLRRDFPHEE